MVVYLVTEIPYPSGFIDGQESDKEVLAEEVSMWTQLLKVLAGVLLRHPQTSYADLQNSLQKL